MQQVINLQEEFGENFEVLKYHDDESKREKVDTKAFLTKLNTNQTMSEVVEFLKDYSWEEKFEWMLQKKLKGNRYYSKGAFDEAIQTYMECLMGMDFKCDEASKNRIINEIQIPCLTNLAMCMKEKKQYAKAVTLCNQAINLNKNSYKPYQKRAAIYQTMRDFDKAIEDYTTAFNLCKEEIGQLQIRNALEEIKKRVASKRKAYANFFEKANLYGNGTDEEDPKQKLLKSKSDVSTAADEEDNEGFVLRYNDDLEELSNLGIFKYVAYPIKMSYKYVKERVACCRRRRPDHIQA